MLIRKKLLHNCTSFHSLSV